MKPSEMSLFSEKEQTLLVSTEPKRLDLLDEDELSDLLTRVRRTRNKYSDLHRRQGADSVKSSGRRSSAASSNQRTARKAEVLEDSVSRVARYLSRAARSNANALKQERLDAARASTSQPASKGNGMAAKNPSPGTKRSKKSTDIVPASRRGATSAANKRAQAGNDSAKKR